MPDWFAFAAVTVLVTVGFVLLARASARAVRSAFDARDDPTVATPAIARRLASTRALAWNVVASHGLLALVLIGTVWYAAVPTEAVGLGPPTVEAVAIGTGLGIALAAANEGGSRVADQVGLEADERLRALFAPDTAAGWAGLLVVVLPLIAVAEELLFRGALIGGLAAGFGLPVWVLAVASSVLFGVGHGLQGPGGVVVTTALGGVLAGAFVVTGSLTVVVIAHYLVNALELVLNEGFARGPRLDS